MNRIWRKTPLDLDQGKTVTGEFIDHCNTVRLQSAIGYVTPKDRLENRRLEIFQAPDKKLEAAGEKCRLKRQEQMALIT
jgi:putative transposase